MKHRCIIEKSLYRSKGANTKSNHEALAVDGEKRAHVWTRGQKWRWPDPDRLKVCFDSESTGLWKAGSWGKRQRGVTKGEAGNFHLSSWVGGFAYWVATGEINFCFKARQIRFKHKIFSLHGWATPFSPPVCSVNWDCVLTRPAQQQKHFLSCKD